MNDKYLADFQIVGCSIKNLKIKNDFISLGLSKAIKRKIDISHYVEAIDKIDEGTLFSGTIILNIKVNIFEKKRKFNLDMAIEGCFSAPVEIGVETFSDMLQVNGITSLYSIARGFVQSTSSQMLSSGCVLLPMVNVVAYSRDLNEEGKA